MAYGLLIFLLAAGLSLVFGMLHVINLVHGSFFMVGGYLGYSIYRASHNFWLALLIAPIVVGLLGIAIETVLLKRLYSRALLDQVVLTFGLSFILADIVRGIWGANELVLAPPDALSGVVQIFGNSYPVYRLFVIALGVLIALGLWVVDRRTRLGSSSGPRRRPRNGRWTGRQYRHAVYRSIRLRRRAGGLRRGRSRSDCESPPWTGRRDADHRARSSWSSADSAHSPALSGADC